VHLNVTPARGSSVKIHLGPAMFIEVVGGAAIANACARLAMLET
jgi:hypothetical protein